MSFTSNHHSSNIKDCKAFIDFHIYVVLHLCPGPLVIIIIIIRGTLSISIAFFFFFFFFFVFLESIVRRMLHDPYNVCIPHNIHQMQIWRIARSAPGTSRMKARLVSLPCFVLTLLCQKSLASSSIWSSFFLFHPPYKLLRS